jgi:hypothetical protein
VELARLYRESGDTASAVNELEQYLVSRPKDLAARIELARCLGDKGDHEHAAQILREIVDTNPDNAEAWLELSAAYNALGDKDRAVEAADRLVNLRGGRGTNDDMNGLTDSIENYEKAVRSYSSDMREAWDKNIKVLRDALRTDSAGGTETGAQGEDAEALFNLGTADAIPVDEAEELIFLDEREEPLDGVDEPDEDEEPAELDDDEGHRIDALLDGQELYEAGPPKAGDSRSPAPEQAPEAPQQQAPMPQQQAPMPQQQAPMPQQQPPMPQQQPPMPQQQAPMPQQPIQYPTFPPYPPFPPYPMPPPSKARPKPPSLEPLELSQPLEDPGIDEEESLEYIDEPEFDDGLDLEELPDENLPAEPDSVDAPDDVTLEEEDEFPEARPEPELEPEPEAMPDKPVIPEPEPEPEPTPAEHPRRRATDREEELESGKEAIDPLGEEAAKLYRYLKDLSQALPEDKREAMEKSGVSAKLDAIIDRVTQPPDTVEPAVNVEPPAQGPRMPAKPASKPKPDRKTIPTEILGVPVSPRLAKLIEFMRREKNNAGKR